MSERFLSVSLMDNHHINVFQVESVWWVEGYIGSELHSQAIKCLSKASAHSSLSNLVPFFIFFTELLVSLISLIGKFPY